MTKITESTTSQAATGHYTDRPDNRTAPAEVAPVEHTAGSEKHPAKEGNHHKANKDAIIELEDKVEELKHDSKKLHAEGKEEKAKQVDRELNEVIHELKN